MLPVFAKTTSARDSELFLGAFETLEKNCHVQNVMLFVRFLFFGLVVGFPRVFLRRLDCF